jgi:hypothetical protein
LDVNSLKNLRYILNFALFHYSVVLKPRDLSSFLANRKLILQLQRLLDLFLPEFSLRRFKVVSRLVLSPKRNLDSGNNTRRPGLHRKSLLPHVDLPFRPPLVKIGRQSRSNSIS